MTLKVVVTFRLNLPGPKEELEMTTDLEGGFHLEILVHVLNSNIQMNCIMTISQLSVSETFGMYILCFM